MKALQRLLGPLFLVFLPLALCDFAPGEEKGLVALHQALLDAENDFTLMCVAAHPDDEDVETLTYYRKKFGVRTVVVVATRGEGGQNEIGPELYEDLAVIRTQEMERAGRITGAVYYSLNLRDFGFSRSAEETFTRWGREEALRRLVHVIRQLKPHVIITNHDLDEGHGHHRAVAMLVKEAFGAAADSTRFRDGPLPWQVQRLYSRLWKGNDATVSINTGEYDPLRGETYAQIAARALAQHLSQGMDRFAKRREEGSHWTYYRLEQSVGSLPDRGDDLFAGMPPLVSTLDSLAVMRSLAPLLQKSLTAFLWSDAAADSLLPVLEAVRKTQALATQLSKGTLAEELQAKEKDLEKALVQSLRLHLRATVDDSIVVPGQRLRVEVSLFNGGPRAVKLVQCATRLVPGWERVERYPANEATIQSGETVNRRFIVRIPATSQPTLPLAKHLYEAFRREPLLWVFARWEYRGTRLESEAPVQFEISPPLEVALMPEATIVQLSGMPVTKNFIVHLRNQSREAIDGKVRLKGVPGIANSQNPDIEKPFEFRLEREGDETAFVIPVTFPGPVKPRDYTVNVVVEPRGGSPLSASSTVRAVEVRVAPGLQVGLVKSFDVTLEQALQALGVDYHVLTSGDLSWGDLSRFDAILIDVRAYLVRADLRANNRRLLEYVHGGGVAIVMYQKTFEWNADYGNPPWAPYPLEVSQQRVTEEDAPVEVLEPSHPLLNFPNKIGTQDWEGWVQERGLYFPGSWAPEFRPLLSMHDRGEKPLDGGLLVAKYGKGPYIYTSVVWYRQLRALVPGAYRMLANLISAGRWRR